MTRLILVRHGRSEANLTHTFAGLTDAALSELGKKQAQALADRLAATEHIDAIYASDLSRAVDTALPTAKRFGLTVKTDKDLREIFAGVWENMTFEDILAQYHADRVRWLEDLGNSYCTSGESVKEVAARVERALVRIAKENDGKTVMIATHWTPLYCIFSIATGTPLEKIRSLPQPTNCAITLLNYENDSFVPVYLNDDAHLTDIS